MSGVSSRQRGDNLPAEVTSFVDRPRELALAMQLLSVTRLLTLTGVGGVGKTRLALRVAAGVRRSFTDGVWLVELASLQDHTLLEQTVADTVGLWDRTARSPRDVLVGHLRDKQLLLVLDNCEHLADHCARLAAELLAAAPGLRILATSRHALRTQGEQLFDVPPLPLPDLERQPQHGKLLHNEAIRLFAERAAAVVPDFEVTAGDRATIARICRRLDGLPLAIELAAARLRVLTPEQVLHRLDDRFRLLSTGNRAVLPRHQTLRAVVDWSYELCSRAEQMLWSRASVFAGGFDLAAAEAVCTADGINRDQMLDLVTGLVDKSILVSEDDCGGVRYRLLETVGHYGWEMLRAAGEEDALRRRHRDYFLGLAERSETEWFGPTQRAVFARTVRERANLRVALEFCLNTPGESQVGLRLAASLHFSWIGCGFVSEGRHWLDRVLAHGTEMSRARATALWTNAHLAVLQGNLPAATAMAEECRGWARLHGDEAMLAYIPFVLGTAAWLSGDVPRAQTLLEEAKARFDALGKLNSLVIINYAELSVGIVFQGDIDRAISLLQLALALCDGHGEQWARAHLVCVLCLTEWRRGELAQATAHGKESLRVMRAFNDVIGMALVVERLAWIAASAGEPERAAVLLGVMQELWPLVGGAPLFGSPHYLAVHEACELRARRALGDRAYRTAFDRGAELGLDRAIDYALGESPQPSPTTSADKPMALLTRRQREVAELVAQGLSNRDIAARLVIAQRTAEGHVEKVLTTLGFTKRTQLIRWVSEQREGQDE